MKLIESKTLGTAAASIEFTSIPQDGTDLVLFLSGRTDRSALGDSVYVAFNSSTSGFSSRYLQGNGASVSSGTEARFLCTVTGASNTANTFDSSSIYIPNYAGSTNKSYSTDTVQENNATTSAQTIIAGLWSNTAAITSITITLATGPNFVAGTIASLYKVTKGSDGIVTTS
jgi:hypothetical protein